MYPQPLPRFWFLQNPRYFIYFLRELTGPIIAAYVILFLTWAIFDPTLAFIATNAFQISSWIGLAAAVFHTITWFWVTVKIAPFTLPKPLQIILFAVLLFIWLGISYFLFGFLYGK